MTGPKRTRNTESAIATTELRNSVEIIKANVDVKSSGMARYAYVRTLSEEAGIDTACPPYESRYGSPAPEKPKTRPPTSHATKTVNTRSVKLNERTDRYLLRSIFHRRCGRISKSLTVPPANSPPTMSPATIDANTITR